MKIITINEDSDSVVLHFETENKRINAYTLASSLVSFADAAKAANSSLNPGCDIEIVVETLGEGSFRAKVKALYESTNNLFSQHIVAGGIIIGLISNYIYERALSVDDSTKIEVHTDEVIMNKGDEKIIVPRSIYDATRKVERDPKFVDAISKTLDSVASDKKITALGFVEEMDSPKPEVMVSKAVIEKMELNIPEDPSNRDIEEACTLQIIKAILEKSKRKWEFMWRGIKISAPIVDNNFYTNFFARDIALAPGDNLDVKLKIRQTKDPETGIYSNKSYSVIEVKDHIPRVKQMNFEEELSNIEVDNKG